MRKRIYIIISEEPVFHPVLAEGLVRELSPEHDIVGFTLAIGDTRQIGAATRLAETFGMFGFRAFACLALQNVTYKVFAALGLRQLGVPFSVSQVAAGHGIPCVTSFNVNDAEHLASQDPAPGHCHIVKRSHIQEGAPGDTGHCLRQQTYVTVAQIRGIVAGISRNAEWGKDHRPDDSYDDLEDRQRLHSGTGRVHQ